MKHVSNGERMANAVIASKNREIAQLKRANELKSKQIESMQYYIEDLLNTRKILCRQINDLVCNRYV